MMKTVSTFLTAMAMLALVACSGQNFVVIEDAPHGFGPNQTLGLRTATDLGALAPTTKMAWLEVCDKVVTTTGKNPAPVYTDTQYVNCGPADHYQQIADKSTSTGFVAGLAAPVIQAGAMLGSAAILADGIRDSGSRTTNNNTTTSSAKNKNTNSNVNGNSNNANGGAGGNGQGGNGGAGGNGGQGGNSPNGPPGPQGNPNH
jgi:hypothetical protein